MRTILDRFGFLFLVVLVCGCGKPSSYPVRGVVKLDGKPAEHVKVAMYPDVAEFKPDVHGFGFGMTDANGAYEIQHPTGEKGLYAGTYKVTLVLWVDSKGKAIPPDAKPSEVPGGVKNKIPAKYESLADTPERVTVPYGGTTKDFDISTK